MLLDPTIVMFALPSGARLEPAIVCLSPNLFSKSLDAERPMFLLQFASQAVQSSSTNLLFKITFLCSENGTGGSSRFQGDLDCFAFLVEISEFVFNHGLLYGKPKSLYHCWQSASMDFSYFVVSHPPSSHMGCHFFQIFFA